MLTFLRYIQFSIKPEKDQPEGYYGGPPVGDLDAHYDFYNDHGKVFWCWGLSNAGIQQEHKEHLQLLLANLGKFLDINGTQVKVDTTGYFYSSKSKNINFKFGIESFKLNKQEISENEIQYIPPFRKEVYYDERWWQDEWILIDCLKEIQPPYNSVKVDNHYDFPTFPYRFYSNPQKDIVSFNTNHLTSGNAFLQEV